MAAEFSFYLFYFHKNSENTKKPRTFLGVWFCSSQRFDDSGSSRNPNWVFYISNWSSWRARSIGINFINRGVVFCEFDFSSLLSKFVFDVRSIIWWLGWFIIVPGITRSSLASYFINFDYDLSKFEFKIFLIFQVDFLKLLWCSW